MALMALSDTSAAAPQLSFADRKLFLLWQGQGVKTLNVMESTDKGASFHNHVVIDSQTSTFAPAMAFRSDDQAHPIVGVLAFTGKATTLSMI
jgi:hypothetical protein